MFIWCMLRYLLFLFLIEQFNIQYACAKWPSLNISTIQLLGLFPDMENTSKPTTFSVHARAMFKAAIVLAYQYNMTIEDEYIGWQAAQTGGDKINALSSLCRVVSTSNIVGIIGPAFSREAHDVAPFAERLGIPVISYSATDPDLSDRNAYPTFYRTVSSDKAAATAIAKLFLRYNWTSSIIIYQNDAFGSNGAKIIAQAFTDIRVFVRQTVVFDIATQTIRGDLKRLLTSSSTRIIVLWVDPVYTPVIVRLALQSDVLGPQFTWILSSSIPLNSFNQTLYSKLVGMLTVEPVIGSIVAAPINTTLLNAAYRIWQQYEPETFPGANAVDYYSVFAFDATWSLIQALQILCSTSTNRSSSCTSIMNASSCFDRRFLESTSFFEAINSLEFLGVSGPIQFSPDTSDRINGTYYVAQNSQSSTNGLNFMPALKYSDPGNWDAYTDVTVIVWPGNSLTPSTDRPILEGVTLRIAVMESIPFTMLTYATDEFGQNSTKFIGYIPDLIALLQYNMKFIPQVILAPSSQTYNQIIGGVPNGLYDMVMGDVTVTAARRKIVSFSTSIFDNSVRIVMRKSRDESVDLLSYLRTFSSGLWLTLLATGLIAAALLCFLERQENEALQNRSLLSLAVMGMWYSLGVIVGYGVDFHVRTAAGRLLTVGLYIVSIVFVATYTANLASYLTVTKSKDIISGIEDIKIGKLPFNRIAVRLGTSIEEYYLREISGGVKNYYPVTSRKQQYDTLLRNLADATFMDIGVAEYATNNIYCNLTLIGADFEKSAFGIVIPKQWIYAQILDVNILSLRENGQLDDLRIKWFQAKTCSDSSDQPTAMGIESLGGLILTFAVISILSLFLCLWKNRYLFSNCFSSLIRRKHLPTLKEISIRRTSIKNSTHSPDSHMEQF